jgi:pyruvate dehydrogenase E2 component (dihydrolipoamide acetyltransferase)
VAVEFHLPDIGEGIAEAEIVRWLVEVGDQVTEDQALAEVETDKAVVEMPAPATGTVVRRGAEAGEVVPVGALFVVIEDGAAEVPAAPSRRPRATPATRRRARELGIDLSTVTATGPGGRILDADVEAAANGDRAPVAAPAPEGADQERLPVRGLRRATVESMTRSWRAIPHSVGFHDVDAAALLDLQRRLRPRAEAAGVPLTLTAFLVKATALALRAHPMVNSSYDEDAAEIVLHHRRHVGVAVDTDDGLIVPVVRDADRVGLLGLARELARLSAAARDRSIDRADLLGGTFTLTNHGPLGGHFAVSIIKPPEAGILGFGRARERPWVVDGAVVPRPILPMSFSADHRIIDGDLSLGFCLTVRELLEDPVGLLLED